MKNNYPKRKKPKDREIVNGVINIFEIMNQTTPTDPLGSYRTTQYGYDNSEQEQDMDNY